MSKSYASATREFGALVTAKVLDVPNTAMWSTLTESHSQVHDITGEPWWTEDDLDNYVSSLRARRKSCGYQPIV